MVRKHEIRCTCGQLIGYEEDYRYMVLQDDIKCPSCGEIVIQKLKVEY